MHLFSDCDSALNCLLRIANLFDQQLSPFFVHFRLRFWGRLVRGEKWKTSVYGESRSLLLPPPPFCLRACACQNLEEWVATRVGFPSGRQQRRNKKGGESRIFWRSVPIWLLVGGVAMTISVLFPPSHAAHSLLPSFLLFTRRAWCIRSLLLFFSVAFPQRRRQQRRVGISASLSSFLLSVVSPDCPCQSRATSTVEQLDASTASTTTKASLYTPLCWLLVSRSSTGSSMAMSGRRFV